MTTAKLCNRASGVGIGLGVWIAIRFAEMIWCPEVLDNTDFGKESIVRA